METFREKTGTCPESVVRARVGEVQDNLEWFVVEGLQCQQHVINQQISVHFSDPGKQHNATETASGTYALQSVPDFKV